MSEPFIGQIVAWAGNFAPRGWAFCDGTLLPIAQNSALFSILGTTYGGDGRTTLGLPDLRGRLPMHPGNGPGLTNRRLGEKIGYEFVTLTEAELPSHYHVVPAYTGFGNVASPAAAVPAMADDGEQNFGAKVNTKNGASTGGAGSGGAHNNLQPYLVVSFIIALQGTYPSRN